MKYIENKPYNTHNGVTGDETIEELRMHNEGLLTELDALLKMIGADFNGKALRSNFVDIKKSLDKNEFKTYSSGELYNDDVQIKQYSLELQSMLRELRNLYTKSVNLSIKIWEKKKEECDAIIKHNNKQRKIK